MGSVVDDDDYATTRRVMALREALDDIWSVFSGNAVELQPATVREAQLNHDWLWHGTPVVPKGVIHARVERDLVRSILEALCRRDGIGLESRVVEGEPARNYELALRLGIGSVWDLTEEVNGG